MQAARSRFADWPRWPARTLIAGLIVLSCWSMFLSNPPVTDARKPMQSDTVLYRAVAARVANGENFYVATTTEQRARHYPLKPFITVRQPLLANFIGAVGGIERAAIALKLLMLATLAALMLRLRTEAGSRLQFIIGSALAALSLATLADPSLVVWHEIWATLLVALGLAVRSRRNWIASLVILLAAALVRELAAPMLAVMAFAALVEGRKREALGWIIGIMLIGLALGAHASALSAYLRPGDLHSQGWSGFGGWRFILLMAENTTIFGLMSPAVMAFAVPLALLGWAGWPSAAGFRGALYLMGFTIGCLVVGRADNFYWGAMVATLLPLGLAFAPAALCDLGRAAR